MRICPSDGLPSYLQCNNIARGPTVRRLFIRNAGDDSFSIQSQDIVILALSTNGTTAILGGRTPYGAPYIGDALTVNLSTPNLAVEVRFVCPSDIGALLAGSIMLALLYLHVQTLQRLPWSEAAAAGVAPWVIAAVNDSCSYCFWHIAEDAVWQVSLSASALEAWGAGPGTSVHNVGRQGDGYLVEDSVIDGNGRCALLKVCVFRLCW